MRCERSPTPVRVGVNTSCPRFCRRSATRRQHQPPCQAPCTRTKVFGAAVCAGAGALPKAAAPASAPALASTPRRVMAASLVEVIMSSLRFVVGAILLGILLGMRPFVLNGANANGGHISLCAFPSHPPPVDNRDNRPPSRLRLARAYTERPSESPGRPHALSASFPRRAAPPASGFPGPRPAPAAQEGGAALAAPFGLPPW